MAEKSWTLGRALRGMFVKPTYRASTELYITNTDSVISLQDLQLCARKLVSGCGALLAESQFVWLVSKHECFHDG